MKILSTELISTELYITHTTQEISISLIDMVQYVKSNFSVLGQSAKYVR